MSSFNTFVLDFFIQFNNNDELRKHWETAKNQRKLKKLLKGSMVVKDPLKPKRGKSGFLFFCDENRPLLLQQNNEANQKISVKAVVSQLGILWQKLKIAGKIEKYERESQIDRERYHNEMKEYREKIKKSNKITVTKSKNTIRSLKVKKVNPFDNYVKSKKNKIKLKNPLIEEERIIETLKEKWKKLSDERKAKYNTTTSATTDE